MNHSSSDLYDSVLLVTMCFPSLSLSFTKLILASFQQAPSAKCCSQIPVCENCTISNMIVMSSSAVRSQASVLGWPKSSSRPFLGLVRQTVFPVTLNSHLVCYFSLASLSRAEPLWLLFIFHFTMCVYLHCFQPNHYAWQLYRSSPDHWFFPITSTLWQYVN